MITHVIVELKYPVEDEYFHMDTVFPNEYYGYGTPLVRCKDCKHWFQGSCFIDSFSEYDDFNYEREETDFCSRAERITDEIN